MESSFSDKVEKLVEEIESQSAAEVVVSIHESAADYRDLALYWGILFGTATLAYKIWSPYPFHPDWLLPNVLLTVAIGYLLGQKLKPLKRLFLGSKRRALELERTSRSEFVRLGVDRTSDRTGLLVLVSRLERAIVLVPDQTLEEKIVPRYWDEWASRFARAESDQKLLQNLQEQLAALKAPLSRQIPRQEGDVNELPDRPVEVS